MGPGRRSPPPPDGLPKVAVGSLGRPEPAQSHALRLQLKAASATPPQTTFSSTNSLYLPFNQRLHPVHGSRIMQAVIRSKLNALKK